MKSKYSGGKHHLINFHTETEFKERWGITAADLGRVEGTTPDAIHMRAMNYGTPFQRRKKPTDYELKYGKTSGQLAFERGIHPVTICYRERMFGSVDLPEGSRVREDLRDLGWASEPKWRRSMESTFFTLEWALARLAELDAQ